MNLKTIVKALGSIRDVIRRSYSYDREFMYFLNNLPQTKVSTLTSGLTVATEQRGGPTACVGLYIDGGARYETNDENGISHFMEHLSFKGKTDEKCVAAQFMCRVDRELVALTGECFTSDIPQVIDILLETGFANPLSSEEIARQKNVVHLEMCNNDMDYKNLVMDYLHATAFQGTSLEQPVIGRSLNLARFDSSMIKMYRDKMWHPRRAVLVLVGGVRHDHVVDYLRFMKATDEDVYIEPLPYRYTGSEVRYRDDSMPQAQIAIAVEGVSFCHEDKLALSLASAYLGGWSRVQGLGVHHGSPLSRAAAFYAEAYKPFNINYRDTGLWGVQFVARSLDQEDMLYNIQDQFMKLCNAITDSELERAKNELKAKLLYKTETNAGACYDIGRWILFHGERPEVANVVNEIDALTAADIRHVCMRYIYDRCPVVAGIGPTEGLPDYTRIRAGMYQLRL